MVMKKATKWISLDTLHYIWNKRWNAGRSFILLYFVVQVATLNLCFNRRDVTCVNFFCEAAFLRAWFYIGSQHKFVSEWILLVLQYPTLCTVLHCPTLSHTPWSPLYATLVTCGEVSTGIYQRVYSSILQFYRPWLMFWFQSYVLWFYSCTDVSLNGFQNTMTLVWSVF